MVKSSATHPTLIKWGNLFEIKLRQTQSITQFLTAMVGISVGTIEVELTGINHAPVMSSEQTTIYQNSEASLNILS